MLIPASGYIIGLIIAMFYYRKPRTYRETAAQEEEVAVDLKPSVIIVTVVAILATFLVQMFSDSMIFGALAGVLVFSFLVFILGANSTTNLWMALKLWLTSAS